MKLMFRHLLLMEANSLNSRPCLVKKKNVLSAVGTDLSIENVYLTTQYSEGRGQVGGDRLFLPPGQGPSDH